MSVAPSFTLNSIMANLSESTEIECSEDTSQFYETLQRYQDETQKIQSVLNSLYQQIDKSISPLNKKGRKSSSVTVSCDIIKDLQDRLKTLEKENDELSLQMRKFAAMSDISSIAPVNSRNTSSKISSRQTTKSTLMNEAHSTKNVNFSDSDIQVKYAAQAAENIELRKQLDEQKLINEKMKLQQINILKKLKSVSNLSNNSQSAGMCEDIDEVLDDISRQLTNSKIQYESIHHISSEIMKEKQQISHLLNSYKDELLGFRVNILHSLKQNEKSMQNNGNNKAVTPNKTHFSSLNKSPLQQGSALPSSPLSNVILKGCEELIDAISCHFEDIQKKSLREVTKDPKEFGKYINYIRATMDTNIQNLRKENRRLTNDISLASNQIKTSSISPDIQKTIHDVMSAINKVSREMQIEHKELLAHLE